MTEVINGNANGYMKNDVTNEIHMESKIYVHTGNIANWSNLRNRKSNDIPANELQQSFIRTLDKWVSEKGNLRKTEAYVNCFNAEKMDENERGLLKVTVKIFLQTFHVESIREAVDLTLKQLGLTHIDSIYLALPPLPQNSSFADIILPYWEEMERLRDAGIAIQISSCDLDQEKLQTLVEMVRIKPEVNQVNLTSCCHMPEDLVKFAKEAKIVLHTHGDQAIMLPDETMQELLRRVNGDERKYKTKWVVRYAVVVKCRGVIKNKGYLLSIDASQENKDNENRE